MARGYPSSGSRGSGAPAARRSGQRLGDPGEVRHRQLLAAQPAGRVRALTAASRARRPTPASRRAPSAASCGAGRTPRRRRRTPRLRVGRGGRRGPAADRDQAGVDVRRRPEHARRHRAGPGRRRRTRPPSPTVRRRSSSPGGATSRSATSDCTMTRPRCQLTERSPAGAAAPARRRCTAGWRPRRSARTGQVVEPRARRRRARSAVARSGARSATVVGSAPASSGSISTAITRRAAVEQPERQRAEAGTDLQHDVVRRQTAAAATIRRTVLASMTKFWPRCLVGRRPSAAASRRTSAGPRSLGPADVGRRSRCGARAQAELAAHRPGAEATAAPDLLGDRDLLLAAWQGSASRAYAPPP